MIGCQNLIRKATYYNYEYYKELSTHSFKNEDKVLQIHVCKWLCCRAVCRREN